MFNRMGDSEAKASGLYFIESLYLAPQQVAGVRISFVLQNGIVMHDIMHYL